MTSNLWNFHTFIGTQFYLRSYLYISPYWYFNCRSLITFLIGSEISFYQNFHFFWMICSKFLVLNHPRPLVLKISSVHSGFHFYPQNSYLPLEQLINDTHENSHYCLIPGIRWITEEWTIKRFSIWKNFEMLKRANLCVCCPCHHWFYFSLWVCFKVMTKCSKKTSDFLNHTVLLLRGDDFLFLEIILYFTCLPRLHK